MPLTVPQPYHGPMAVNLAPDLVGLIYDLPPGGMQHLRREKEGIEGVITELATNVPKAGADAGISPDVYARFVQSTSNLAKIRAAKELIAKLNEVLDESEVWHEHERETWIAMMADSIKSAARRMDASIEAPFELTLEYYSRTATKAAKTRRKKAEEAATDNTPSPTE